MMLDRWRGTHGVLGWLVKRWDVYQVRRFIRGVMREATPADEDLTLAALGDDSQNYVVVYGNIGTRQYIGSRSTMADAKRLLERNAAQTGRLTNMYTIHSKPGAE
jgi:hypothetical protein